MRRWLVLAAWAAGVIACLVVVAPARLVTDLGAFLPVGATPAQELVADQLRQGAASRLLMVAVGDEARTADAGELERLRADLEASDAFSLALTRPDPTGLAGRDLLFDQRYLLSDRLDADSFREPELRARFIEVVAQLRRGDPGIDEARLARDPGGEFEYLLRQWAGGTGTGGDGWRLDDGRPLLLLASAADAYDLSAQAAAIAAVEERAAALDPALPVEIGGAPTVAVGARDLIRGEAIRVTTLASIAAVAVLVVALRAVPAVLLALVPVLSGLLAGVAAVRLGFGEVHGITLAFGATLLGVTIDYPLHHLWRSRLTDGEPAERAIRRPLLVGALSTALGFAALAIAGVSGLQQLATLAVTGIVVAAVVTSWVLPLLRWRPLPRVRAPRVLRASCPRWLPLTLAAVLLLAGTLAVATSTRVETDLAVMSPVPGELAARDGRFRAALGLAEPRFVVAVRGADREAALRTAEAESQRLAAAVEQGLLDRFDTVTRILPSAATQRDRRAALPAADELRPAVAAATAELPLRADAFQPFVDDVDASRERAPLEVEDLPAGLLRDWVDERLVPQGDEHVALIYLAGVRDAEALATVTDQGQLLDLRAETSALVTGYQRQAIVHFAVGCVLIAMVLLVGTRSLRRSAEILLTAGGAVGGTVLILTLAGTALSVFHVIALLLVVGLSIDYGIFARPGDRTGAGSVSICALSSALAFAILATADIPLLRAIGVTVACGTILAWALALLFAFNHRNTTMEARN